MKVKVNKDVCIGCGACVGLCPDVFNFNDDGFAEVITENIKEEDESKVIEAVEGCPTEAIEKIN